MAELNKYPELDAKIAKLEKAMAIPGISAEEKEIYNKALLKVLNERKEKSNKFIDDHFVFGTIAKPTEKKKEEPAAFFRENGKTGIPKFKTGQTVYVKATGEELTVERISKKGLVIPGQPSEGRYHYSTNNDSYYEEELTDVKPAAKKEKKAKSKPVFEKTPRNKKKKAEKKQEKVNKPQVVFQGKYLFVKDEAPIDVPIRATLNEGDWITFEYQNVTDTGKKVWWKIEDAYRVPRETMDIAIAKLKVKTKPHETKTEAKQRVVNADQFIKDVEHNADIRNMTESQIIGLGLQFETNYRSYVSQKRDEGHDTKKRLSPTPENLIRWMKHPGHFDLIGVDTFTRTDATADYRRLISKQKFWNKLGIKI